MIKNAFVLLTCVPGEEEKTETFLTNIPQIKNTSIVNGAFDIIARIKTSSMHELGQILWNIRRFPTVRATLTLKIDEQDT